MFNEEKKMHSLGVRKTEPNNRPFANLFVIEYQIIWNTWKSPRKTVGAQEICQITECMSD